jgi:hypothetical protein
MKFPVDPVFPVLCAIALVASCGGSQLGMLSDEGGVDEGGPGPGGDGGPVADCGTCGVVGDGGPDDVAFGPGGDESTSSTDGPTTTVEAGVTCSPGTSSGSGGSGGSCTTSVSETCSNGFSYKVSCSCPKAKCDCASMSGSSGGGAVGVSYAGCSSMCSDDSAAWEACGFPH